MALKGHVEIELKDVNTGEVERIEGDNMVTNAIRDMIRCLTGADSNGSTPITNQYVLPIANHALGGLFIFEKPLSEDADAYEFPVSTSNKLRAFAGDTSAVDNDLAISGNYNAVESGKTETGYRHVWDFSTAQCNGEIGSLALTNVCCGNNLFSAILLDQSSVGVKYLSGWGYAGQLQNFKYDDVNQYLYAFSISASSSNTITAQVYRKYMPKFKYKVNDVYLTESDWEPVGDSYSETLLYSPYTYYWNAGKQLHSIDSKNDYTYMVLGTASSQSNFSYTVLRIKMSTLEIDTITLPTLPFTTDSQSVKILDNHIIAEEYGTTNLHIIDLNDPTSDTVVSLSALGNYFAVQTLPTGVVLCTGNSKPAYIVYMDGTYDMLKASDSFGGYNAYFHKLLYANVTSYSRTPQLCFNPCYLGTIHNLPSPITKTAAQTMKVIYTLTDAGN